MDKSEIKKSALEEIERKVMDDFPRFVSLDMASIIGSFLKLHYVPRSILNEINQQQALSTFNKYACLHAKTNIIQLEMFSDPGEPCE